MSDRRLAIGLFSKEELCPAPAEFAGESVLEVDAFEHEDAVVRVLYLYRYALFDDFFYDELEKTGKALDELGASSGAEVAIMDPSFNFVARPPWFTSNWIESWMFSVGLYNDLLMTVRCELAWVRQAEALDTADSVLKSLDRSFRLIPAAHGVLLRSR